MISTNEFWKGRRVLVTGGAGFIGSHLSRQLVDLGASVRVVDNLERGKTESLGNILPAIDFRQEDLRNPSACETACTAIDVVFHLASKVGGIGFYLQNSATVFEENIVIDRNVWRAACTAGVSRYLFASSAHVYPLSLQATPDAPPILEEQAYPANPDLSYGWAKLIGEKLIEFTLAQDSSAPRPAILRLIGVYGPNQDTDLATGSAIPVFMRRAIEYPARQPFTVMSSGQETRSYCYITDIVKGMILAVENLEHLAQVGPINMGSEERISIGQLVNEIISLSGKNIEVNWDKSKPTTIWGQVLDCRRAREYLGWESRTALRAGLESCYKHIERILRILKPDLPDVS